MPDSTVESLPVGPWEVTLSQGGVFADFAIANREYWVGDEALDRLRQWCDSLSVYPEGLGAEFEMIDVASVDDQSVSVGRSQREALRSSLMEAHTLDNDLLFERESPALLLCLWEQRMMAIERPDEAELDEFISVDPDLATARDVLEQPELLQRMLARHAQDIAAASVPNE